MINKKKQASGCIFIKKKHRNGIKVLSEHIPPKNTRYGVALKRKTTERQKNISTVRYPKKAFLQ